MTRMWISIFIILTLTGMSAVTGHSIDTSCRELIALTEELADSAKNGDTRQVEELTEELAAEWEEFRRGAEAVVRKNKLADVDCMIARLKRFTDTEADAAELSAMIKNISNYSEPC